jgi:peptidoglycan/LPS O-acetylase OafA/YrhL
MPEPVRSGQRYLPGLDGLRALAVFAVIAYHLGLGWAPGGLLGVGVFFTLSGYLITGLLLASREDTGRLRLGDFWLRRARRLLPALAVMLAVVAAWVTLADPAQLPGLRGGTAAAAAYLSNWYLIAQHSSYFARFAPPSPLGHLWSLAVEEQFYLAWPWLLWLALRWLPGGRRGPGGWRPGYRWPAAVTLVLAAASAIEMAGCYHAGYDPTRAYEGTDTRAFGLLIGAALALLYRPPAGGQRRERLLVEAAGAAGLAGIGVLVWRAGQYDSWVYPGGMVVLSLATAAVVAAAACPGTLVGRLLGWEPLRWLGVRSYGIYLWHFPVILLTSQPGGPDPVRAAAQVALTVGVAAVSWRYVEEPVRRGGLGRAWARARNRARRSVPSGGRLRAAVTGPLPTSSPGWAGFTAVVAVLAVGGAGLAGLVPAGGSVGVVASGLVAGAGGQAGSGQAGSGQAGGGQAGGGQAGGGQAGGGQAGGGQAGGGQAGGAARPGRAGGARTGGGTGPHSGRRAGAGTGSAGSGSAGSGSAGNPPRSSCRAVAHIGDSTSEGMISPRYLPRAADRLPAQYARVGAAAVRLGISGARSVVETLPHQLNAYQVARRMLDHGFRGCWVLALGTNDTANVAVGSPVGRLTRIERMMSLAGGQPVLWVTVKSLLPAGPYAEAQMRLWNSALRQACARYPNMRIFDWAAVARASWFISDGVHYTPAGYAARARLIADALARAFPAHGRSAGCVVG